MPLDAGHLVRTLGSEKFLTLNQMDQLGGCKVLKGLPQVTMALG